MGGHDYSCCGCSQHGVDRRTFLATVSGTALGGATLAGCATPGKAGLAAGGPYAKPKLDKKAIVVHPALTYSIPTRRKETSWRSWGAVQTQSDVDQEVARIDAELKELAGKAEFPVTFLPVAKVPGKGQAEELCKGTADVMLIYGAGAGVDTLEALISPDRYNLLFLRHLSGPVSLWYEITSSRLLRKTVDEFGQPGLDPCDVMVDEPGDLLWRLRSLYALKNTVGSRMVALGSASGWGVGGQKAPNIARELWKMDIRDVSYDDLGKRIQSAQADAALVREAEADAEAYLKDSGIKLATDKGYVSRAFLLTRVFEQLMAEADAQAFTINSCMGTIMPVSQTTACLCLSLINDSGAMAFCESDFVVIPSGVLLHHISGLPVFLNDPTYPHHGVVTLAHCTAPRKMDGKHCEKTTIMTHFESDYGAAPKVDMRIGQEITVIDPDFDSKRWLGFLGRIKDNPFLDICRSQIDVEILGDCDVLAETQRGFHWMASYGNHLKETGYALHKMGIDWTDLSKDVIA